LFDVLIFSSKVKGQVWLKSSDRTSSEHPWTDGYFAYVYFWLAASPIAHWTQCSGQVPTARRTTAYMSAQGGDIDEVRHCKRHRQWVSEVNTDKRTSETCDGNKSPAVARLSRPYSACRYI